ncbi:TIGR02300 family protein [Pseudovibrio exalbescens]|uniref:TIGR02300 family protein n=1 Tax=Pseudovibrio exalbescens TaxID=197461 RepID=UPI0023662225|nr:TIGR02300 family protein [Pseudovibrio exalbescens]MDD7909797.1 TIGR02300 family protein [Pseudovibrio exalbescens]
MNETKVTTVARPELGTKRLCAACGAKYYDLNRDPITCPKCGEVFDLGIAVKTAKAAQAVQIEEEEDVLEPQGAEIVSLEDADAEVSGDDDVPDLEDAGIDDEEISTGDDEDVFLEEDDDENAVPGIVVSRDDDES